MRPPQEEIESREARKKLKGKNARSRELRAKCRGAIHRTSAAVGGRWSAVMEQELQVN